MIPDLNHRYAMWVEIGVTLRGLLAVLLEPGPYYQPRSKRQRNYGPGNREDDIGNGNKNLCVPGACLTQRWQVLLSRTKAFAGAGCFPRILPPCKALGGSRTLALLKRSTLKYLCLHRPK